MIASLTVSMGLADLSQTIADGNQKVVGEKSIVAMHFQTKQAAGIKHGWQQGSHV